MVRIGLRRLQHTDDGTFGVLIGPTGVICHSIELPWKDNQPHLSCIPTGEYFCVMVNSPRFGWVYQVMDVEGRTHILIHAGNFAGDTSIGRHTDSLGCILPGMYRGSIQDQHCVLSSRAALSKIHRLLNKQPFTLIVEDESCCK